MNRMITLASLIVVSLVAKAAAGNGPDAVGSEDIRFVSYNIKHGQGNDQNVDLSRTASVLKKLSPDVVGLQEVDRNATRSGGVDQAAELGKTLGMRHAFGSFMPFEGGDYGLGILSRYPITKVHPLRLPDGNEPRVALAVEIRMPNDQPLMLVNVHFDWVNDDGFRFAQASAVKEYLNKLTIPYVLLGDFNDQPESRTLSLLRAGAVEATKPVDDRFTFSSTKPRIEIDFIFAAPKATWTVQSTEVIDEPIASDHRPVIAVMKFDPTSDANNQKPNQERKSSQEQRPSQEQRDVLDAIQSVMGSLPGDERRTGLDIRRIQSSDQGSYVRELITYQSEKSQSLDGSRTPAYLCVPKTALAGKPTPAVLCLHPTDNSVGHQVVVGLGGKEGRSYASELAQRGYVTLSPAYPQLANYEPDLDRLGYDSGSMKAIWDNIRGLDLLQSLPYVDSSRGFAAIGHSLGGHNAIFTASLDDRITVVVSSCGFDSFQDYYDGDPKYWQPGRGWCQTRYMPRLANYQGKLDQIPFDFPVLLASLAPRKVFINAPLGDSNFRHESVDRCVRHARPMYEQLGKPENIVVRHPDCDHDFPEELRSEAYRTIDSVLVPSALHSTSSR